MNIYTQKHIYILELHSSLTNSIDSITEGKRAKLELERSNGQCRDHKLIAEHLTHLTTVYCYHVLFRNPIVYRQC